MRARGYALSLKRLLFCDGLARSVLVCFAFQPFLFVHLFFSIFCFIIDSTQRLVIIINDLPPLFFSSLSP
uniref:Uncharacterized protein n=1 Tax=Leishmania guyanensis TaxID=5670 RepID=A0A1E1IWW3_LEIGU|nr:Hypothetical protein BN36_2332920 [Leishmania guyanensis]